MALLKSRKLPAVNSAVLRGSLAALLCIVGQQAVSPNLASAQDLPGACVGSGTAWSVFFTAGYQCLAGDKVFTSKGTNIPTDPTYILTGSITPLPPAGFAGDIFQFQANFGQPFATTTGGPYYYEYTVAIVDPSLYFSGIQQDSDVLPGAPSNIQKDVWFSGIKAGTPDLTLNSIDGAADPVGVFDTSVAGKNIQTLYVRDTLNIVGNGVTSVTNKFVQQPITKTPGPLAIAGAGMAFGYSRKIRARIKVTSKATTI